LRVSLITATPAKFIDYTMAPESETAEAQVAEAYDISDDLRDWSRSGRTCSGAVRASDTLFKALGDLLVLLASI
jgi:hypothetical protein